MGRKLGSRAIAAVLVVLVATANAHPAGAHVPWTPPVPINQGGASCAWNGALTFSTDAYPGVMLGGREVARLDCRFGMSVSAIADVRFTGSRPLLIVTKGGIAIDGRLTVIGGTGGRPAGGTAAVGGATGGPGGELRIAAAAGAGVAPGGGGRSNVGGTAGLGASPGTPARFGGGGGGGFGPGAGASFGPLDLTMLHGGSGGGGGAAGSTSAAGAAGPGGGGGGGGGAVALVSAEPIRINGVIDVRGGAGGSIPSGSAGAGGGGGGGAVLLSAPGVYLTGGRLDAGGGAGGTTVNDLNGHGGAGGAGHIRVHTHRVVPGSTASVPALPAVVTPPPDPTEATPRLASVVPLRGGADGPTESLQEQRPQSGNELPTAVLSDDGRFLAYTSPASGLGFRDANGARDVFVYDRDTNTTDLISSSTDDAAITAAGDSFQPNLSADGRFVLFRSSASDLSADDPGTPGYDFFRHDRESGETVLVSVGRQHVGGPDTIGSGQATSVLSADGSTVAMGLMDNDRLLPNDNNFRADVYVWRDGVISLGSINAAGTGAGAGFEPGLSGDGRMLVFRSASAALTATPKANCADCGNVFVRDLESGVTEMVSVNAAGTASGSGGPTPMPPVISRDGRFVAYWSNQPDIVSPPVGGQFGPNAVYLRDLHTDTSQLVSSKADGTDVYVAPNDAISISADGRYVTFIATNTPRTDPADHTANFTEIRPDLPDWCRTSCRQAWVRDTVAGVTFPVATGQGDDLGDGIARSARVSHDGRAVIFVSNGRTIEGGHADGQPALYRYDVASGRSEVVARTGAFDAGVAISGDGSTVAFDSALEGLAPGDADGGLRDVYLTTVNPPSRGIQPNVAVTGGAFHAAGHVPCPGSRTEVTITLRQGAVETSGTVSVPCAATSVAWSASGPMRGLQRGAAEACAVATLHATSRMLGTIQWCRPVTLG